LRSKDQSSSSLGERKCKKSFFAHVFAKRVSIDLHQTKTKMITVPLYTYRRISLHFISGNALFCDVWLSVTYLSFSQYWNRYKVCFFEGGGKLPLTLVKRGVIF